MTSPRASNDFLDMLARARADQETTRAAFDNMLAASEPVDDEPSTGCPICEGMCHDDPAELYAELVGVAEIAERLNVRKPQVTNWSHRAPSNGFPAPVHAVTAGRLWRWPDIERWYRGYVPQRQKIKPGRLP